MGPLRQQRRIDILRRDFTEDVEIRNAAGPGPGLHRGHEGAPEFRIDVLGGIDPESVNPEPVDPAAEDFDHPGNDPGMLGRQIVEPREVAIERALTHPVRIATVVIVDRVVEPGWLLDVLFALGDEGCVGEGRVGQFGPVGCARNVIPGKTRIDRRAIDPTAPGERKVSLAAIGVVAAFTVLDHIGGVVDDDVHIDLDPAGMRGIDKGLEFRLGSEMRVDRGEVGHPIAVVTGALVALRSLHRLVLEHRGKPDRGDPQALDVVEPASQPLEVAAVVEPLGGRIIAGDQPVARQPAAIVCGIAVVKAVRQDKVDHFLFGCAGAEIGLRLRGRSDRHGDCGQKQGKAFHVNSWASARAEGAAQVWAINSPWLGSRETGAETMVRISARKPASSSRVSTSASG